MAVLHYGNNSSVQLEFADGVARANRARPVDRRWPNPAAALTAMLAEPIEYPSLARSTTPGDRVVLALDRGVPAGRASHGRRGSRLVEAGVAPDGISVLQSDAGATPARRSVAGCSPRRCGSESRCWTTIPTTAGSWLIWRPARRARPS